MQFFVRCVRLLFTVVPLGLAGCTALSGQASRQSLGSESRWRLAQAAEESGDFALAEEILAAASVAGPANAAVQLRYADVLVRRGKIRQADDLLLRHIATVSDTQALRAGLAAVHVLEGAPARAIAAFDSLLATNPNDIRFMVNKAVALDLLGRHDEAQSLYRQALAADPDDAVVINNFALSLMLAGRMREAADVAVALRDQSDILPRIRAGLGVVLAANDDLSGARAMVGAAATDDQLMALAEAAAHP
jgi:Flp pilus assembly protein TadD